MKQNLFENFTEVSEKAWKQKIQVDLKGANYNDTLIYKTNDGIDIKPFYHKDSYKKLALPILNDETIICQTIFIDNEKKANGIALEAMQKGADMIRFIATQAFDYKALTKKFDKNVSILFELNFLDTIFIDELFNNNESFLSQILIDPIGHFGKTGNWYKNHIADINDLKTIVSKSRSGKIWIDATTYQNAGATISQQIAYALAHLNEYLNANNIENKSQITVSFAMGSNYFFEIAKLRAFRHLFQKLIKVYNLKLKLNIIAEPSKRNKTIYDYNVNLLRTTTECMSAILGNANVVSNVAYDNIYHRSNEFASRIARNQLLILKEESYFMESKKAANGAYFIEQISYEIADKSLSIFKEIEKNGGFIAQLLKGSIQRKIEDSANKEQQQFDAGDIVLLGTNIHINELDSMSSDIELYPFVKINPRKTIIKPIIPKRLSEKIDKKRLDAEKKKN